LQEEEPDLFPAKTDIDTLVLIDREVDLWSCVCTPLTYEGLVDELIGIDAGRVKLDPSVIGVLSEAAQELAYEPAL
jgi:hypothetical protein